MPNGETVQPMQGRSIEVSHRTVPGDREGAPATAAERRRTVFTKVMSDPVPIPEAGIARAVEILRSGRPFRYGEESGRLGDAARFEAEFAAYVGRAYALAVNSCGCSLFLALKALGLKPGDPVLCNAFTLAPVPGAIVHAGGRPVLVDMDEMLSVDLADLEAKIAASGARVLMLSHMRGHVGDLDAIAALCDRHGVALIEDCAHTLGGRWGGRPVGSFGRAACYSAQTFKHINGGEGGILATDDPEIAARATVMSGSYMLYEQHGARPPAEAFEAVRDALPNFSMRMTDLTAALLRPQLALLDGWVAAWNAAHDRLGEGLAGIPHLLPIRRDPRESYVGSSFQFRVEGLPAEAVARFVAEAKAHGVYLKWFGAPRTAGFTSRYDQWGYAGEGERLPNADRILATLIDMRLPLSLDAADCDAILAVLAESVEAVASGAPPAAPADGEAAPRRFPTPNTKRPT